MQLLTAGRQGQQCYNYDISLAILDLINNNKFEGSHRWTLQHSKEAFCSKNIQ